MTAPRLIAAFLLGASALVLGSAFLLQYGGGAEPCLLCVYQRYPYALVILLAALALLLAPRPRVQVPLLALSGAVLLAGFGLAFYHMGVEQGVFAGPSNCSGPIGPVETIDELRERLLARPTGGCARVAVSILGLSLANWNAVLSLLLAAVAFGAALWLRRRMREA